MFLAFSLEVSKFLPLFLNLFEQCLTWLGCVLHRKKVSVYLLRDVRMLNLPSIVTNAYVLSNAQCTGTRQACKRKSPVGVDQRGFRLKNYLISKIVTLQDTIRLYQNYLRFSHHLCSYILSSFQNYRLLKIAELR